ncbi:RnfABCDGE type electron transport complex subunit G [Oribacterium sp. oral taxon 102]|uniref:RnfABCDGE type electron transport complex subunit G n=1 Tax=Oribacterium sp. oral taxon 102 TaxID=671214 RepID=UPI0015BED835|nr:RnfABCDGE type electron transport complex subunit G [Oribacterium sp. oral taxon 102]NWO22280.1 RnfABCDGE type electron transport complex subunit G [Oribacterium sp. oral taxon 102]
MKKNSFVRDACVLCLITLISGLLLGGVYGMTKETIYLANNAATIASYKEVMPAADYDSEQFAAALTEAMEAGGISADNGGAKLSSVVAAKDAGGAEIGYILKGKAAGYGGDVVVVVGVKPDLTISGISFPETLPETAGLGQKATEPAFYEQFAGKGTKLSVKKGGGAGENEIDAISGATITSTAVVNVVNAATEFVESFVVK